MRKTMLTFFLIAWPLFALAQGSENIQRSSSPSGFKVRDTAQAFSADASLNGGSAGSNEIGSAINSNQGSAKSATQIQGNTAVKARAQNLNAAAAGRGSVAGNAVGAIGK